MEGILSQPILLGAVVTTDHYHRSAQASPEFDGAGIAMDDVEYLNCIIEQDVW